MHDRSPHDGKRVIHRKEERLLRSHVDAASKGGGRLVFLLGEEGAGKMTICRALGNYATSRGFMTVAISCEPDPEPFAAALELKRSIEESSPALIGVVSAIAQRDITSQSEIRHLSEEFLTLVSETARGVPLLIIINNAENMDVQSFQLLHYLALRIGSQKVMILCALDPSRLRSKNTERIFTRMKGEAAVSTVEVALLTHQEVDELAAGLLGVEKIPVDLSNWLFEVSRGNPKFVVDQVNIIRMFMRRRGVGVDGVSPNMLKVAPSIMKRYGDMVDSLSDEDLEILKVGAAMGGKFSLEMLSRAMKKGEEDLLDHMDALISLSVLQESGEGRYFNFRERNLVEYIYNTMNDDERKRMHLELAKIMESQTEKGQEVLLPEVGKHYALAEDFVHACESYTRAGDGASLVYAKEDAVRFYNLALKSMRMVPDRFNVEARASLMSKLSDLELEIGFLDDAESLLLELSRTRSEMGDAPGECESDLKLGDIYRTKRRFDQAMNLYTQAYNLAKGMDDRGLMSTSLRHIASVYYYLNDHEKAMEYVTSALSMTSAEEDPIAHAKCLALLGSIHSMKGEYARGVEIYRSAVALLSRRDPREEALVRRFLAESLKYMGDFQGALEEAGAALRLAESSGYTKVVSIAHAISGESFAMLGDAGKAREHIQRASEVVRESGDRIAEIILRLASGALHTVTKEYQKAISDLERAERISRQMNVRIYQAEALFRLGVAYHNVGNLVRKRDNLHASFRVYRSLKNRERAMLCKRWLDS